MSIASKQARVRVLYAQVEILLAESRLLIAEIEKEVQDKESAQEAKENEARELAGVPRQTIWNIFSDEPLRIDENERSLCDRCGGLMLGADCSFVGTIPCCIPCNRLFP